MRVATVKSSSGASNYIISVEGREWQCSCLGWTRHVPRRDCKHIRGVKIAANGGTTNLAMAWATGGYQYCRTLLQPPKSEWSSQPRRSAPVPVPSRPKKSAPRRSAKEEEALRKKLVAEQAERERVAKEKAAAEKEKEKQKMLEEMEKEHDAHTRFSLLELE